MKINDTNNNVTLTNFNTSILAGITSAGEGWTCGISAYDGHDNSLWANSSSLAITSIPSDPPSSGGGKTNYFKQTIYNLIVRYHPSA